MKFYIFVLAVIKIDLYFSVTEIDSNYTCVKQ